MLPRTPVRSTAYKVMRAYRADPRQSLKEISVKLGVPEGNARVAFKRALGITFREFVKRKRKRFISENQHLTNKELSERIGGGALVLMPLIRELKAEGKLVASRRLVTHRAAPKGFYMPSALPVMRLMAYFPSELGLSRPELSEVMGMGKNNLNQVIKSLLGSGYLKKGKKIDKRQYYQVTQEGMSWIRSREAEQVRRDKEAMKNPRMAIGVSRRREKENELLKRMLRTPIAVERLSPEVISNLRRRIEYEERELAISRARKLLA
jgi:DNA-binding transcriptional regulator GbsR (MarR family)